MLLKRNFWVTSINTHIKTAISWSKKIPKNYIKTTSSKKQQYCQCIVFILLDLLSWKSDCSSNINVLDLKDQIYFCQKAFWNINGCIQRIYIVNSDSLLHIISFRLTIIRINLQLPINLYVLSFKYNCLTKKYKIWAAIYAFLVKPHGFCI